MPPVSPEILLALSPSVLRALVSTFAPKTKLPKAASPRSIARLLFTRVPAPKLASALATFIARFSTRAGRLALVEAARATSDPRADGWLALPYADVAALLAIEIATTRDPKVRRQARRLFALASLRVERDLPERATYELLAESAAAPAARDAARLSALLASSPIGARLLDTWSTEDADGALRLALFLEQPAEIRLVRDASTGELAQRSDAPVAVDVLRVLDRGARVAITTSMPELLPVYARALGLSLRPSFTLRPFDDATPDTLARAARAARELVRLDVVGARTRRSDGARVESRATNALDPSLLGPRAGYLDRTTVRGHSQDARVVDAFLQLPHRIDVSDRALEAPLRAALGALGTFAPGSLPDDARSLAPYEHADWRWRAAVTDAGFAQLASRGLLVRTLAAHATAYDLRMHGAAYVVRDVPGEPDLQYALAEDRSLGARLVTAKDRVAWRLDVGALALSMTRELGAQPAPAPLAMTGLLDLGLVPLPSGRLRVVYAMAAPPAGWVDVVRRACGLGVTPVVLVPAGHAGEAPGMLAIELDVREQLGVERAWRVLARIAEALGVLHELEPFQRHGEDVVIDPASQRVWVRGVLVPLSDTAYRLLELLARAGGVVPTKELGAKLSAAGLPDEAARKAKRRLEAQVSEHLRRAGDGWDVSQLVVAEGKKGYRLGVSTRVVRAEDGAGKA